MPALRLSVVLRFVSNERAGSQQTWYVRHDGAERRRQVRTGIWSTQEQLPVNTRFLPQSYWGFQPPLGVSQYNQFHLGVGWKASVWVCNKADRRLPAWFSEETCRERWVCRSHSGTVKLRWFTPLSNSLSSLPLSVSLPPSPPRSSPSVWTRLYLAKPPLAAFLSYQRDDTAAGRRSGEKQGCLTRSVF